MFIATPSSSGYTFLCYSTRGPPYTPHPRHARVLNPCCISFPLHTQTKHRHVNPDINPPTLIWTNVSIYSQIFTPTQTHTMNTFVYGTDAWKTSNATLPLPNEDLAKPQKQGRWKSQANCSIYNHNVCGGP